MSEAEETSIAEARRGRLRASLKRRLLANETLRLALKVLLLLLYVCCPLARATSNNAPPRSTWPISVCVLVSRLFSLKTLESFRNGHTHWFRRCPALLHGSHVIQYNSAGTSLPTFTLPLLSLKAKGIHRDGQQGFKPSRLDAISKLDSRFIFFRLTQPTHLEVSGAALPAHSHSPHRQL